MKSFQSKFIFKKYIHGATRKDTVAKRDCSFPTGLSWVPSTLIEGLTLLITPAIVT